MPVNPSVVPINTAEEQHAAENVASLDRIGATALKAGDLDTARSFFMRASTLEPDDLTAILGSAQALVEEGQPSEAIDTLRLARARISPNDQAPVDAVLGKLLVLNHHPDEAEAVFRDGLGRLPRSVQLLTGLGVSLDAQRRFRAAQDSYRKALAVSPENVAARNDLSLSIAIAGDPGVALTALEALRTSAFQQGASEEDLRVIEGNIALAQAMRGDVSAAERAGAHLKPDADRNVAFYSAVAGGQSDEPPFARRLDSDQ